MPRCFIALPTSNKIKSHLTEIQSQIHRLNPWLQVKWTDKQNMHVTLEFLGDLSKSDLDIVKKVLSQTTDFPDFDYELKEISAFPNIDMARTIIVKIKDKEQIGFKLQNAIHEKLENILDNNRPWTPHLTLGRIKNSPQRLKIHDIKLNNLVWTVNEVILYQSELTPNGPIYSIIDQYLLNA
ncbi:MAG: RNA 2',3'-cyclic phosphodiesterase [bacterium]